MGHPSKQSSTEASGLMSYGDAIAAMKQGKLVRRYGWDQDKSFIFMQIPAVIGKEIVPMMQSLPASAKAYFDKTFSCNHTSSPMSSIYYDNQVAIVRPGNRIEGYVPTIVDILSEEWIVLDY
jgi:hypothetical protein